MQIQQLFLKPIDRPIDGVIKADDDRNLQTELEEYVITRDVARGLGILTERYLEDLTANGVWISGFFGSGKSHLLKMLSLVLEGAPLDSGARPAEILLPKVDDEIVQAQLRKAASIPSRSVLFNIDQKFDGIGGDHSAPILEVFVKVLNELQGYYGKQGYIARFEHDLDVRGDFVPFKETYLRVNGSPWEKDREAVATARKAAFGRAYAEHFGVDEAEALGLMRQVREDYRVSVESFAHMVRDYIDRQPAGFRLNFFVDEVGQFVGQDSRLMLNLQTVAETLGTVCNGRSWVFVTSQADLEGVLGGFRGMDGQDITKIMGRFKTRLTLASADVREVIQKRLLAKSEPEPDVLTSIYDREKDNLQTLYRFGDSSIHFKGWRGSDEFCAFYPFHPYQFDLFQLAITQLSKHNAFTGRYMSVGERSMLEVFQEAAKSVRTEPVGRLTAFDAMYDGISASIRGDMQTSIKMAERQLDPLPVRILKALFLLKWVREFKATPRNVAILLIDRPDVDIRAHEKAVHEALAVLESQSYLQRNGEVYEFLTDVEKDVEVEIKSTDVDESQVAKLLGEVLFADVLRDPKIRYEANGQNYDYARKLDDHLVGRDADLAVNIITTEHPSHAHPATLAAQNTGKAELLAILPADTRVIDEVRLFLKTQKYIQQNTGGGDATRKAILDQRGQQNSTRRTEIQELAREFLGRAPLYLNGSRLDTVGPGDARNRFAKAYQELVAVAFPSLRMLKGAYSDETLSKALLDPDDLLSGGAQAPSEAEQEILTYVMRNQNNGERTSVEEIIRTFERRPYGWYAMAVLTLLARLFRMGKVELRTAAEPLDARTALEHLRNSRQHGGVRVRMQQQFDAGKVTALKKFHHEFFDSANPGTDARSVGQYTIEKLADEVRLLTTLLDQAGRYPFLTQLQPVTDQLRKLSGRDYAYLLNNLGDFEDELLTAKDDLIAPIKAFMHGSQRVAYDDALAFLREEQANFAELPPADVQPLRELEASPHPYRGNVLPTAKAAVTRLRQMVHALLAAEQERALAAIAEQEARLRSTGEFELLTDADRQKVIDVSDAARDAIQSARFVTVVRDHVHRYSTQDYPKQLTLTSELAAPPAPAAAADDGSTAAEAPAPRVALYTAASTLQVKCDLPYIATEAELDQWLTALREAARAELKRGYRLVL